MNFTKPNRATIRYTNSQWLREDPIEASVGLLSVPKTGQKTPSPRRDASGIPVGMVAVPNTVPKTPFATPGCLWITCGQGGRAKDRSKINLMPVEDRLWDGSW